MSPPSNWRARVSVLAAGALVAAGLVVLAAQPASAAATGGVGATLPYVEVQAENSATNGTVRYSIPDTGSGAVYTTPLSLYINGTKQTNIALGKLASASSQVNGTLTPATATDGDAHTYWESANNAFPQWRQVDLGSVHDIGKVTRSPRRPTS